MSGTASIAGYREWAVEFPIFISRFVSISETPRDWTLRALPATRTNKSS
jgi:hypothetical protein